MGSPKTVETKSQTNVNSQFKPFLDQFVDQGQSALDNRVGTSPTTTQGINQSQQFLSGANSGAFKGMQVLDDTLAGKYLDGSNPYKQAMLDQMNEATTKAYQGTVHDTELGAVRNKIFGGSAYQKMVEDQQKGLATGLSENANKVLWSDYQTERANQLNAIGNYGQNVAGLNAPNEALINLGLKESEVTNMDENAKLELLGKLLAAGQPYAQTVGTAPNPNYKSPFETILGAGVTLGGAYLSGGGSLFGNAAAAAAPALAAPLTKTIYG